jgi:hypothetical protein
MDDSERVIPVTRYNYYKYYESKKEQYQFNRELRERKKKLEEDSKEHYKQFWQSFLIRRPIDISPSIHK